MPPNHVPDGKTQVALFQARSRARTAEVQRRSRANETMDRDRQAIEQMQAEAENDPPERSAKRIRNAEATIVMLLQRSAAYRQAIERLTETWGGGNADAIEQAEEILQKATKDVLEDQAFQHTSEEWARKRSSPETVPTLKPPSLKRKVQGR